MTHPGEEGAPSREGLTIEGGDDARTIAKTCLVRIDQSGAFANIVVPRTLDGVRLSDADRRFVTQLVYGTTRMRRSCDWLVDRFITREVEPEVRAVLRMGAYQLVHLGVPPHAAVDTSVQIAPKRARGFVNAVLRRVADAGHDWPDDGIRLSYPDWIVRRLCDELGREDAVAALEKMNETPAVTEREDGYTQDTASQWVTAAVDAQPGDLVADVCAAPGGKATGLAATGAHVVAADRRPSRVGLVVSNAQRTGVELSAVVADARRSPYRSGAFDRVLVDAPCSGLGVLRRRPDARWRIEESDIAALATLQREIVSDAVDIVAPGGRLVYSVCTLVEAETVDIAAVVAERDGFEPVEIGDPWRPWGTGGILLPQDHDTDGMALFVWQRA